MISVLHKAADILELLARSEGAPVPLREIAAELGLKTPTCANIVRTLLERGLLEQAAPRQGYSLGPAIHRLARSGPYRRDLSAVAEPHVRRLAEETGETVLLAAMRRERRVVLYEVDGRHDLQVRTDSLGADVYASATGRLLLAHLPDEQREELLRHRGLPGAAWPEASSRAKLSALLDSARRAEIVTIRRPGIVGLAAPIHTPRGVEAALGLYLPAIRFQGRRRGEILAGVLEAAHSISNELLQAKEKTRET